MRSKTFVFRFFRTASCQLRRSLAGGRIMVANSLKFFALLSLTALCTLLAQAQHRHGMPMPSPTPAASPSPTPMTRKMPGMQLPSPTPTPSPDMHNVPMPAASPAASPQQMSIPGMNMPMPAASPSVNPTPSPMGQMPGMEMGGSHTEMNMGPLLVMNGDDMGIRVGSSENNIMSMGAMGSGTAWQPSSAPMHMLHWNKNDWLLMFHYNVFVGVNHQGGPRGVTKFESANWFMPMAYHQLGRGTLQLRGMFSA